MKNTSLYSPLIEEGVSLVQVQFHTRERGDFSGKAYTYKSDLPGLQIGDTVLCETGTWFSVAKVIELNLTLPLDDLDTYFRWVVARLDLSQHEARLAREQKLIETLHRKRLESLRHSALAALGIDREELLLEVNLSTPAE